jgi:hypothetical protein
MAGGAARWSSLARKERDAHGIPVALFQMPVDAFFLQDAGPNVGKYPVEDRKIRVYQVEFNGTSPAWGGRAWTGRKNTQHYRRSAKPWGFSASGFDATASR